MYLFIIKKKVPKSSRKVTKSVKTNQRKNAKKCLKVHKNVKKTGFYHIDATIRKRRESRCLPYAGFLYCILNCHASTICLRQGCLVILNPGFSPLLCSTRKYHVVIVIIIIFTELAPGQFSLVVAMFVCNYPTMSRPVKFILRPHIGPEII